MERVRYFNRQLLTAADLQTEQDYFLDRHQRLNLRSYGVGVVSGLRVSVENGEIHVRPGVAIDPQGNEIVVKETRVLLSPIERASASLTISYTEILTRPVPGFEQPEFSRIEDGFILRCVPCGEIDPGSIALADLRSVNGRWRVHQSAHGWSLALCVAAVFVTVLWLFRKA